MPELSESTVVSRAPNTAFRELEGKMFIVGAASTKLVMLNETGCVVWSLLEAPLTVGEITDRLVETFEVDRDTARQDCVAFVESMATRDLLLLEQR